MYLSRSFLLAQNQALSAANDAHCAENARLRRELASLQQATLSVASFRDLAVRHRQLVQAGVPCFIQSGLIRHSFTRAVIS